MLAKILLAFVNATSQNLAKTLEAQTRALPLIDAQRTRLTDQTRRGRDEAKMLHRETQTLNYQVERLEEGVQRLDVTLNGYKKRTDDAEAAVKGLYQLQPFVDPEAEVDDDDEGVGSTPSPVPSDEATGDPIASAPVGSSPRGGMGWTGTMWDWLLPSLMEPPTPSEMAPRHHNKKS